MFKFIKKIKNECTLFILLATTIVVLNIGFDIDGINPILNIIFLLAIALVITKDKLRGGCTGITLKTLRDTQVLHCIDNLIQKANLFAIPCPLRKAIFKDMLVAKFKTHYNIMNNIINNEDVGEYTGVSDFNVRMCRLMDELHISEIQRYEELSVPSIVIDKFYIEMQAYKIDCYAAVGAICKDSVSYSNHYERLHAIIWILLEMVNAEFEHLRNALMSINGDISSIKYIPKGKKIEVSYQDCNCPYCSCREQESKARLIKQLVGEDRNCENCKDKRCELKNIDVRKLKQYTVDQLTSFIDRHIVCQARRSVENTQVILKMATDNIIKDIVAGKSIDELAEKYSAFKKEVLLDYIKQYRKEE